MERFTGWLPFILFYSRLLVTISTKYPCSAFKKKSTRVESFLFSFLPAAVACLLKNRFACTASYFHNVPFVIDISTTFPQHVGFLANSIVIWADIFPHCATSLSPSSLQRTCVNLLMCSIHLWSSIIASLSKNEILSDVLCVSLHAGPGLHISDVALHQRNLVP